MSKVIVLGASGFVGKDLVSRLKKEGFKVHGTSSKDLDLASTEAIHLLKQIVHQDDTLVFVSALTPDRGRDVKTVIKNLSMAENVGAFLEQSPVAHFVYVSSDAVYEDAPTLVRESTATAPSSYHGYMHLGRELILKQALMKLKSPWFFARPCSVYGAEDTHNSYGPNRFIRTALKDGKIALFGEGEEIRDHISVEDVSSIIIHAIKAKATGILNIASGNAVSFMEVAKKVQTLCRRHLDKEVRIETSARGNPITHRHFDITELLRAFPTLKLTTLEAGLLESLKKQG